MLNYLRANNTVYLNISMKKITQVLQAIKLVQKFDLNQNLKNFF